jgi:hypothetical protein
MNPLLRLCAIGAIALFGVYAVGAERKAVPQTRATTDRTAMPDWSGEWEMVGLTPNDGGLYVESAEEMASRWDQPAFTTDLKQRAFQSRLEHSLTSFSQAQGAPPGVGGRFACTFGFPILMLESPATFEALITPRQTSLVFSTREVRNVYTDGREHTPADEIWPTYWGDSIGHWEGQTLVIDTIAATSAFLPGEVRDDTGAATVVGLSGGSSGAPPKLVAAFSSEARYSERIHKLQNGELEVDLTVRDPMALSSSWRLVRHFRKMAGVTRMVFQDCEGDTRHEIVNGQVTLKLAR